MRKITILLLVFAALAATAQNGATVSTVEAVGKKFVFVTTWTGLNGETSVNRSAPVDSSSALFRVLEQSMGYARQLADMAARTSAMQKEKEKADALYAAIGAGGLEDAITANNGSRFLGTYYFTDAKAKADVLTIEAKKAGEKRLNAKLESGGKGTVKVEADGVATIIGLFRDSKNKVIDVKFTRQSEFWVAEIDGTLTVFSTVPPDLRNRKK